MASLTNISKNWYLIKCLSGFVFVLYCAAPLALIDKNVMSIDDKLSHLTSTKLLQFDIISFSTLVPIEQYTPLGFNEDKYLYASRLIEYIWWYTYIVW